MFANTLVHLVRGVSVLRDGQTVGLRLGTSYLAGVVEPGITLSTPVLSAGLSGFNPPANDPGHEDSNLVEGIMPGAGRSRCLFPSRLSTRSGSPVIRYRWPGSPGGTMPATVSSTCPQRTGQVAIVGEASRWQRMAPWNPGKPGLRAQVHQKPAAPICVLPERHALTRTPPTSKGNS